MREDDCGVPRTERRLRIDHNLKGERKPLKPADNKGRRALKASQSPNLFAKFFELFNCSILRLLLLYKGEQVFSHLFDLRTRSVRFEVN